MRWSEAGAANLISLRALKITDGRWEQFWKKIMFYGGFQILRKHETKWT
jgi:hypothetical protein